MNEVHDDGGLLTRARRGDEAAFSELFSRYQRAVYHYAVYMGGRDVGDDIVQETFLVVLRQSDRQDELRGSVLGYLVGIARRLLLKRFGEQRAAPLAEDLEEAVNESACEQPTVLDDIARAEAAETVRAAVESLPAGYREAVVLCELQELDYAAAADVMGCPVGTVRSRLHRARALLARKLSAQPRVEGMRQES
jgi:RNA polymerase sigma-70 factor, ECF subfamily